MSKVDDLFDGGVAPLRPNTMPLDTVFCPHCNHTTSKVRQTIPNCFGHLRPGVVARYHQCHSCRQHFWTYTDEETRDHKVSLINYQRAVKMLREREQPPEE